jgi:hypothetical protein
VVLVRAAVELGDRSNGHANYDEGETDSTRFANC